MCPSVKAISSSGTRSRRAGDRTLARSAASAAVVYGVFTVVSGLSAVSGSCSSLSGIGTGNVGWYYFKNNTSGHTFTGVGAIDLTCCGMTVLFESASASAATVIDSIISVFRRLYVCRPPVSGADTAFARAHNAIHIVRATAAA